MRKFEQFEKEEEYWFSLQDLEEYDLKSIPETLTIIIEKGLEGNEDFPLTEMTRKGDNLYLGVSIMLYPEDFWNHKYSALQFCEGIIKGMKIFEGENLKISDIDYQDNGSENGICIWWNITLPDNSSLKQIETIAKESVKIAFNQGLNYLEGLSSILILGKDTGDNLEKLKRIASVIERKGYNPIIIKEEKDLLGETVIQKVLRYGMISKFIIVENTDPSGHLYEVPHIIKMAEKISVVLQEEGKGATWMFEEIYFNLKTVKKFNYENNQSSFESVIEEGIDWAEKKFIELCDYQTRQIPWLKN